MSRKNIYYFYLQLANILKKIINKELKSFLFIVSTSGFNCKKIRHSLQFIFSYTIRSFFVKND